MPTPSAAATLRSALTPSQLRAVRQVMQGFVDDDLAHGVLPAQQLYCHACAERRSAPGFVLYEGGYQLCNACATAYEVARMRGRVETAAQFVATCTRARR